MVRNNLKAATSGPWASTLTCLAYMKMNLYFWKHFIFLDETRMELYFSRRQYVRKPVVQRLYNSKTVKYGGFLFWYVLSRVTGQKCCAGVHPFIILKIIRRFWTLHLSFSSTMPPYSWKIDYLVTDSSLRWNSWIVDIQNIKKS